MGHLVPKSEIPETPMAKSYQEIGTEQFGPSFSSDGMVAQMTANIYKAMGLSNAYGSDEAFMEGFLNIQKALATGSVTGFADATALRLENLDDVMTSVLYSNEHLVLFNWLNRVVSKQPVYEYNVRKRYGDGRRTLGFQEGGTPRPSTGQWERKTATVRFMGIRGGVTHQASLTGALGGFQISPAEEEERGRTLDLLGIIERWAIHGDKDLKALTSPEINYDGILRQLEDAVTNGIIDEITAGSGGKGNVIDKQGQPLTFDDIEAGTLQTFEKGFLSSTRNQALFCNPNVSAGLSLQKLPSERAVLGVDGTASGRYVSGVPLGGFKTQRGVVPFRESIFMEPVEFNDPLLDASKVASTAPAAPATITSGTSADAGATWSGTFYYFVSALNDGGESLATAVDGGSSVGVSAGEKVTLTISSVTDAQGYRVYRGTASNGSDAVYIGLSPAAVATTFVDTNARIPGTTDALLLYNSQDSITIPQMSPLVKLPLGVVSTTVEFLLLLYHTIVVKAPERIIWWKNVGNAIES